MSEFLNPNFFKAVVKECHRYNLRLREIETCQRELEHLGFCKATVVWRNGYKGKKNMYLYHPKKSEWVQQLGHSSYEYVGAKKDKQQAALARLGRYDEYQTLKKEAELLRHKLKAVHYFFDRTKRILFGSQMSFVPSNGKQLRVVDG